MNSSDDFWMKFVLSRDQPATGTSEPWIGALALVGRALAPPAILRVTGRKDTVITSVTDPKIAHAVSSVGGRVVELEGDSLKLLCLPGLYRCAFNVLFPPRDIAVMRALFTALIHAFAPDMAYGHFSAAARELEAEPDLPHGPLFWLNYFGPVEAARRGGVSALRGLSGARLELIDGGALIEIGEPDDALTAQGHAHLLAITRQIAPPPPSPTGPVIDVVVPSEPPPLEEVAGVRGIREGSVLWVMKHVAEGKKLKQKEVGRLRALIGKGSPLVTEVRVLFSHESSAKENAASLRRGGVDAWYVSDIDLQKRRAPDE